MEVRQAQRLLGSIGVVTTLITILCPITLHFGFDKNSALVLFCLFLGFTLGMFGARLFLDNLHMVGTFRLHGWRNGLYGIRMDIIAPDTPYGEPILRAHGREPFQHSIAGPDNPKNQILWLGSQEQRGLPRCPNWRPVQHSNSEVIVSGDAYAWPGENFDHENK